MFHFGSLIRLVREGRSSFADVSRAGRVHINSCGKPSPMARLPFCIGNLHRIRGTGATVHSNGRTRENQQSMVLDNPVRTVD
jgi:hypothetical protein